MLIGLEELRDKYAMDITGIVHIGAHLGEEAEVYDRMGIPEVFWIEGNPDLMEPLKAHLSVFPGQMAVCALISDTNGIPTKFNVTNNGMSSSILEFGTHPQQAPDVWFIDQITLNSRRVDSVLAEYEFTNFNMLNIDLQGAELLCLRGAPETLTKIDYIYTEVNRDYLYENCCLVEELDSHLSDFDRVETYWTTGDWGDALYIRRAT